MQSLLTPHSPGLTLASILKILKLMGITEAVGGLLASGRAGLSLPGPKAQACALTNTNHQPVCPKHALSLWPKQRELLGLLPKKASLNSVSDNVIAINVVFQQKLLQNTVMGWLLQTMPALQFINIVDFSPPKHMLQFDYIQVNLFVKH